MDTKRNEYKPTNAEQKLLEALANPANKDKSITDICNLAKVSRKTYYQAFKKPEFVEYHDKFCKDLVKQALIPMVNTFIKEGLAGSFQHGKVILEMGKVYTEKQQQEITGKDGGPLTIVLEGDLKEWAK